MHGHQERRRATPATSRPSARLMLPDESRGRIADLAATYKTSLAELSRLLGRGDGYVSDYLNRKVPYDLAATDRHRIARFFGVDPETLKAPPSRPDRWRRR